MYINWLQKNVIEQSILSEKYLKINFSQMGEDDFIRGYFWEKINRNSIGTYLDIGCYHETLYSNTKLLNLVGWSGFAVDANQDLKQVWENARPLDKFLNFAIKESDEKSKSINLYRFQDGAFNTVNKNQARLLRKRGIEFRDKIKISSITLIQLAEYLIELEFDSFDFVNIDIEFVDYLDDLSKFISLLNFPQLLCLEWVSRGMNLSNYKESREYKILQSQNYEIISIIGDNIFASRG